MGMRTVHEEFALDPGNAFSNLRLRITWSVQMDTHSHPTRLYNRHRTSRITPFSINCPNHTSMIRSGWIGSDRIESDREFACVPCCMHGVHRMIDQSRFLIPSLFSLGIGDRYWDGWVDVCYTSTIRHLAWIWP
jgi:hypothetical protein